MPKPRRTTEQLKAIGSREVYNRKGEKPIVPLKDDKPPFDMSPAAEKIWQEMLPLVERMRIMSETDKISLATYCVLVAQFVFLHRNGEAGASSSLLGKLAIQMRAYANEFGLTPAARCRLSKPVDDIEIDDGMFTL